MGDDDGSGGHCVETSSTMTLQVPKIMTNAGYSQIAGWTPIVPMSPTSLLAHSIDATGAKLLAIIDANGVQQVASIPDGADYALRASKVGDCAMINTKGGLGLACPGLPYELATGDFDTSANDPLFALETGGQMIAFTQTFASFTEITRTGPGQWTEHEQYESSISFPTDALLANGSAVACFIDSGDHAVVTIGGSRVRSAAKAQWCKLAFADDMLTVVTDIGTVTQPLSAFSSDGVLAVAGTPSMQAAPTRLVSLGGAPAALSATGSGGVVITPLDGSAAKTFPVLGGGTPAIDVTGNALNIISASLDSSGQGPMYPETVLFETHCL